MLETSTYEILSRARVLELKLENVTNREEIRRSKTKDSQRLYGQRERDRIIRLDFVALLVISFSAPNNRIHPNRIVSGES